MSPPKKFLGSGDMRRILEASEARFNRAAQVGNIQPIGRLPGGRKLWSADQIPAFRKALAATKERNYNQLAYENS